EIDSIYLCFVPIDLTLVANSDINIYDGTEQTLTGYQPLGLLPGQVPSGITPSGSGTNVGDYPVTFTRTPVIMDGAVNVTEKYAIELVNGELTITPKTVTFLGESDSKTYDGATHTITTITPTGLLEGHTYSNL